MTQTDCLILGIESSCDETSCSVVSNGTKVLSNVVLSQIPEHAKFGGVVPEVASRLHLESINNVIDHALGQAAIQPTDLSAIAVAHEPGLIGSLLVGVTSAKALAIAWGLPLIGVNHVHGHAYGAALDSDDPITYPAVALICSGGHTSLYHCKNTMEIKLLGATIDDAAGEAFDKVASILKLGYPGGPAIDKAASHGDPKSINFPRSLLKKDSLNFSFSGLKTAVLYHVNGVPNAKNAQGIPKGIEYLNDQQIANIAASFQQAVVDVMITKIKRALQTVEAKTIIIGGGVAANSLLREAVIEFGHQVNIEVKYPPIKYCTDNGAMIAGLAYHYLMAGETAPLSLAATPTVRR